MGVLLFGWPPRQPVARISVPCRTGRSIREPPTPSASRSAPRACGPRTAHFSATCPIRRFTVSNSQWIGPAKSLCGFAGSPQAWRSERGGRIDCEPAKEVVIDRATMTRRRISYAVCSWRCWSAAAAAAGAWTSRSQVGDALQCLLDLLAAGGRPGDQLGVDPGCRHHRAEARRQLPGHGRQPRFLAHLAGHGEGVERPHRHNVLVQPAAPAQAYQHAIAPDRQRIAALGCADQALRKRQVTHGGIDTLLSELNPRYTHWKPPLLELAMASGNSDVIHLAGRLRTGTSGPHRLRLPSPDGRERFPLRLRLDRLGKQLLPRTVVVRRAVRHGVLQDCRNHPLGAPRRRRRGEVLLRAAGADGGHRTRCPTGDPSRPDLGLTHCQWLTPYRAPRR